MKPQNLEKITFVENDGVEIITEENQNAKTCNTCVTNIVTNLKIPRYGSSDFVENLLIRKVIQ